EDTQHRQVVVPQGLRAFTSSDAGCFLKLLPGPVAANGLPESIRFWKQRIESSDADPSFRVGLMYGPSGCGKSSFLRAGLRPHLAERIIAVCVNATATDTELQVSRALAHSQLGFGPTTALRESLSALAHGCALPRGCKLLLVIDQFEQWLHTNRHDL